jgi:hypothetical protein
VVEMGVNPQKDRSVFFRIRLEELSPIQFIKMLFILFVCEKHMIFK